MCFECNNQITKTLTITQLTKHHCKQLVPASEVFHIAITIILANVVVELGPVQKSGKLSKNVFVLEHSSQLYLAAKLQNQVRFISKNLLNRLNFNHFKERLVHFNGTVVNPHIK